MLLTAKKPFHCTLINDSDSRQIVEISINRVGNLRNRNNKNSNTFHKILIFNAFTNGIKMASFPANNNELLTT